MEKSHTQGLALANTPVPHPLHKAEPPCYDHGVAKFGSDREVFRLWQYEFATLPSRGPRPLP